MERDTWEMENTRSCCGAGLLLENSPGEPALSSQASSGELLPWERLLEISFFKQQKKSQV